MMFGVDWGMGGSWLLMAIVVIAMIAIAWTFLAARPGRDSTAAADAAAILQARFARGEISESEYEQARRLIGI